MIATAAKLRGDDIVVVSQKVVSKAEDRFRKLGAVSPSERAEALAHEVGKDPRLVELILAESAEVLRATQGVIVVQTHSGIVCANAGIDSSNVPGDETVLLLPEDADASARRLRAEIERAAEKRPAVIVADSLGRAWRLGQTEVAIGCVGLGPLDDWRGRSDRHGLGLQATQIAIADEVAAAADLARDKASGTPVVIVRGLGRFVTPGDGPGAAALVRPKADDLFR
jgi:coenzyme F420-0:L-glutamate ligase/coenzyme F420-1:gamma-L-glutamate ligase